MAINFPPGAPENSPFEAPNGITYTWNPAGYWEAESGGSGGGGGGDYVLPIASDVILGGIKVGTNLSIDNGGVLSSSAAGGSYGDSDVEALLGAYDFHIIPGTNATYDIGTAEKKVRHLFLSDNSLRFVDSGDNEYPLSVSPGPVLMFNGEPLAMKSEIPTIPSTPNLQAVTDIGSVTTNDITAPHYKSATGMQVTALTGIVIDAGASQVVQVDSDVVANGAVEVGGGYASGDGTKLWADGRIFVRGDSLGETLGAYQIYRGGNAADNVTLRFNFNGSAEFANGNFQVLSTGHIRQGSSSAGNVFYRSSLETTQSTHYGIYMDPTIGDSTVDSAVGLNTNIKFKTTADASTIGLTNLYHFRSTLDNVDATRPITQQVGFLVDASCIGATSNYAFYSGVNGAADQNNYQFYAAGDAPSWYSGNITIGTSLASPNITLSIDGNAHFAKNIISGGNPHLGGERGASIGYEGNCQFTVGAATSAALRVYTVGNSDDTISLFGDGSATFASEVTVGDFVPFSGTGAQTGVGIFDAGVINVVRTGDSGERAFEVYNPGVADPTMQLMANGSASFDGDVSVTRTADALVCYESTSGTTLTSRLWSEGAMVLGGTIADTYVASLPTANIALNGVDGSATFDGLVEVGSDTLSNYGAIFANNSNTQATCVATNHGTAECVLLQADSAQVALKVNDKETNTSDTVIINGDGSAEFAGNATFGGSVVSVENTLASSVAPDFTEGNMWVINAGVQVFSPVDNTTAPPAMSGVFRVTGAPAVWGTSYKFPGGTAPTINTFPAIIPFYIQDSNNILCGAPVEGIA